MNLDVSIVNKGENSAFLLGGEIVDRPLPRGSFMDQGENSRVIVECIPFCICEDAFHGELELLHALVHRCVEPFASVLRSRCFVFFLLSHFAQVLCFPLAFGQLERLVLFYLSFSVLRLVPCLCLF